MTLIQINLTLNVGYTFVIAFLALSIITCCGPPLLFLLWLFQEEGEYNTVYGDDGKHGAAYAVEREIKGGDDNNNEGGTDDDGGGVGGVGKICHQINEGDCDKRQGRRGVIVDERKIPQESDDKEGRSAIIGGRVRHVFHSLRHYTRESPSQVRRDIIDVISRFIADVLHHPTTQEALSETISNGITNFLTSPHARENIDVVLHGGQRRSDLIKQIGKEVPGMARDFTHGLMETVTPSFSLLSSRSSGGRQQGQPPTAVGHQVVDPPVVDGSSIPLSFSSSSKASSWLTRSEEIPESRNRHKNKKTASTTKVSRSKSTPLTSCGHTKGE